MSVADTEPTTPSRVLVVEDDAGTRNALMLLLRRMGHEVKGAGSAKEALSKLTWFPQIVVLDLMLPDGLGIAVLRHIRMNGSRCRVAIVTGVENAVGIPELVENEPDIIFTKPLDLAALTEWMRTGVCQS